MTTTNIIARECRFVIHIPAANNRKDMHLIKEQVHYSDGSIVPNIRLLPEFKRPYYITKQSLRSYKQKREWTSLNDVMEKQVTQSQLRDEIANVLNKRYSKDSIRKLCRNPYIYGTDISSTSIIKKMYLDKYPNVSSRHTVATFDIETDVVNNTDDIIIASVIFQDKAYVCVLKSFLQGYATVETVLQNTANKYIGEYIKKHNLKIELYLAKDSLDLLRTLFSKVHEWKPDFLAIWNMDFDMPKVLKTLEKYKIDPAEILCDPNLPRNLRVCRYIQGAKKKITSSGKETPIPPAAQWHTLLCTSSFYVIDAMCVYKQIRTGSPEEPSYSLDSILNKELGIRKLSFTEADKYSKLAWHQFMQTNYKMEYVVYNIFDSLSMLELDEKTKDLAYTFGSYAYITDYHSFKSQPKRIIDALHYYLLDKGYIIGTSGFDEEEDETLGLKEWILVLPSFLTMPGLKLIEEDESLSTNIRCMVFDADAVGAYPSATSACNVSKETTKRELINVFGRTKVFRKQNMNLVLGHTNAIEYSTNMFKLPKPNELLELFTKD